MKAFFYFLQTSTLIILIPLLTSNRMPFFYVRAWGVENATSIFWGSFAFSLIIFVSCMWWAFGSWSVQRPWAMMALMFGAVMSLMNYGCALIAIYGLGHNWFVTTIGLPSYLFQAITLGAMVMNYLDTKRLNGQTRSN